MKCSYYLTTKGDNTVKEKRLHRSNSKKTMLLPFYYILLFKAVVVVTTIKDASTLFSFTVKHLQNNRDVVR